MPRRAVIVLVCAASILGCERKQRGAPGGKHPAPPGASQAVLTAPKTPKAPTPSLDPPFAPQQPDRPVIVDRPGREAGHYGGELALAAPADPKTFNPLLINDVHGAAMLQGSVYVPLVGYDRESFKVEPLLAHTWERAEDGRRWTFHLRPGLRWSDGSPLTSADVVFTFSAAMDASLNAPDRELLTDTSGALPEVQAKDDLTVVFTLQGVHVLFLEAVASIHLLPRHRWEGAWKEGRLAKVLGPGTPPDQIVSCGPFRVRRYVPGDRLELGRNPYSPFVDAKGNRLPYLDRIVWRIVPDYDEVVRRFGAGDIDIYDQVRPTDFEQLKRGEAEGRYSVFDLGVAQRVTFLAFNLNSGARTDGTPVVEEKRLRWVWDRRFRRAVSHAIDRETLVKTALKGRGRPLHTIVTQANRVWKHEVHSTPYSPETGRKLLADLGFRDRNRDGVLEDRHGTPLKFRLATTAGDSLRMQAASHIAGDLKRIGLAVEVKAMPFSELVSRLTDTYEWEAVLLGLGGNVPPDPAMWNNVYLSSGQLHVWHPRQAKPASAWEREIDQLVSEMTGTHDFLLRKAAHDKILDVLAREQPMVFLYAPDLYVAGRVRVGNLRPSPLRPHGIWNVEELFLAKAK